MAKTHHIKIAIEHFTSVEQGRKTFEIRLNDRNYQEGDILHLMEHNTQISEYTGNSIDAIVLYVFDDVTYLQPNYVALAIDVIRTGV